jgi:hypothetical protein
MKGSRRSLCRYSSFSRWRSLVLRRMPLGFRGKSGSSLLSFLAKSLSRWWQSRSKPGATCWVFGSRPTLSPTNLLASSARKRTPANASEHAKLELSRFVRRLRTNADALEQRCGAPCRTKMRTFMLLILRDKIFASSVATV